MFYDRGLGRLRHQWQGEGIAGEEFRPETHEYASDLDLCGAGSLFEVLRTARTVIGRAALANWLLHPANTAKRKLARRRFLNFATDMRELCLGVGRGPSACGSSSDLAVAGRLFYRRSRLSSTGEVAVPG